MDVFFFTVKMIGSLRLFKAMPRLLAVFLLKSPIEDVTVATSSDLYLPTPILF